MLNAYQDTAEISQAVKAGRHRDIVGGMWDEIGTLQLRMLRAQGLKPQERLLDIGCGSLRGGVHLVSYLEPNHYFGLDLNPSLIESGYEQELADPTLRARLPRANLIADGNFTFSRFEQNFDRALAFSLFTHMPINSIRVCLEHLAEVMKPGGTLHATFFELPVDVPNSSAFEHAPAGIITSADADPYHYRVSDFEFAAAGLPWRVEYVGSINHPRGQRLINFVRTGSRDTAREVAETRSLSLAGSANLAAGDDHYRAYVGPPDRFDFMSATQFSLLFQLGLRDHDNVLDFGCGSLRLGRLLIPYLQPERYFGIEPNRWLIEDGITQELGRDAISIKRPHFAFNEDFDCRVFGQKFDFIIAQSIVTHAGPNLAELLFRSVADSLAENGLFLFSYIPGDDYQLPENGWHYPGCIVYSDQRMADMLKDAGLYSAALPWYHPAAKWFVATRTAHNLPTAATLTYLRGAVVRGDQFAASVQSSS